MKNRTESEFVRVYQDLIDYLKQRGLQPKLQRLDNKSSEGYQQTIKRNNINIQFTPTQIHCRNIAERSIQTLKNYFITILTGLHKDYPKDQWDHLLLQTELTLNLLQTSRINKILSAYEQLEGPLAPLGTKVIAYNMRSHQKAWDEHGQEGWYIAPAPKHYRYYSILMKATKQLGIPPRVKIFPEHCHMPNNSSTIRLLKAAKELTHALKNPEKIHCLNM